GKLVRPRRQAPGTGEETYVYTLKGPAPYTFTFLMDGGYRLNLQPGDILTLYQGEFHIGDEETNEVKETPRLVVYTLSVPEPRTITVDLQGVGFNFGLSTPDGDDILPVY